jgi:hypothetical protein
MTEKGWDLYGAAIMLHQWSDQWLVGDQGATLRFEHHCGAALHCDVTCSACSETLVPGSIAYNP